MTQHGLRVESQALSVENTREEGIVGMRSSAAAEAQKVGFSIEVYRSVAARQKETDAQKSFAKNGKLFQVQCGPILLRIPSILEDEQPEYEKLAHATQRALDASYRDC